MKILMVANTYFPIVGGLEKSIASFSHKFREWGHDVQIVVPELEGAEESEAHIIRVPSIHPFKRPDFSLALPLFPSLEKMVEKFEPDIIHAHHPFLMGEMALRLAARFEKPLIFTYHIMFDQYAHYLPLPSTISKRFLVELAVGFANLSTRVIAPSESVREILLTEGVKTWIDVVPTGVDIEVFAKDSKNDGMSIRDIFGIPQNAFVLGYVGRLAPEKNLEFLSRAVIGFMEKFPNTHFMIAGKGPSEEIMEKLFSAAGMEDRFHSMGVLQGQTLVDFYHAMDVFVFASLSETQGMVLCEAMASGVPVIALDAPGAREVVKDHVNGRLLKYESAEEFYSALSWFLKLHSDKREQLKLMARNTAKMFSTDVCAFRALKVYEAAIRDSWMPTIREQSEWHRMMRRLRTEWNIMTNFGKATRRALGAMISS